MNKNILISLILMMPMQLAWSEVTVSENLTITIPKLIYSGSNYSVKLDLAGSCWVARDLVQLTGTTATTATLGHNGFDFSTNTASAWEQIDLYTTTWANKNYPAGYKWGDAIWAGSWDYNTIGVKDQGIVSLDSVINIPTDWTADSATIDYPLEVNHVYISKARDGFIKFKVVSLPSLPIVTLADGSTDVQIEFVYTSGTSF